MARASAKSEKQSLDHPRLNLDAPPTPPPGVADLPQLIHRLEGARRSLRTEIERLSDADLDAPCVREMSVAKFLRMVVRHEVWHAGQVAVIRRLYRLRRT